MEKNNESVVLMMPVVNQQEDTNDYGPSTGATLLNEIPVSHSVLTEFASQYTGYELESIEVHVKGAAKTGGVTQLFVGLSGEAGVKLVLKKKQD